MIVIPVLTAVFEAQNESRFRRWLDKCYIGGENLVSKAICQSGAYIRGRLRIFENKPPPQSGPYQILKKWGLIFGGIRYYLWEMATRFCKLQEPLTQNTALGHSTHTHTHKHSIHHPSLKLHLCVFCPQPHLVHYYSY